VRPERSTIEGENITNRKSQGKESAGGKKLAHQDSNECYESLLALFADNFCACIGINCKKELTQQF